MITREKIKEYLLILFIFVFSAFIVMLVYRASMPTTYELQIGDKVNESIVSNRPVIDEEATQRRANEQANQIPEVFTRSNAISEEAVKRVEEFLRISSENRAMARSEAIGEEIQTIPEAALNRYSSEIIQEIVNLYGISINQSDVIALIDLSDSVYQSVSEQLLSLANTIMASEQDSYSLRVSISTQVENVVTINNLYRTEYSIIGNFLRVLLEPNMIIDEEASLAAKEAARQQVYASPVLLPAGTVIVNAGETLSEGQFQTLSDLDLIQSDTINYAMLLSIVALLLFAALIIFLYLRFYEKQQMRNTKDWIIAITALFLVLVFATYISRFNNLLIPVYFVAIVLSTYYGLRTSLVITSVFILLLYPVSSMDSKFLFISILASWASAMISATQAKNRNYLSMIMGTILACLFSSALYSALNQETTALAVESMFLTSVTGAVSSVLAVGLSPVFEAIFSRVSPTKLIRLSEPSQPLLRKLFLEAPGTYQHSMMIANLAETAAERIGVDALLIRVASYYHDIGKTWNPMMYTENQQGFNPHSLLNTEESVKVIMRHVSAGEEMAKKNRLPQEIIDFIVTHHGTTVLQYFYMQAQKEAEENGQAPPKKEDFTYPGRKPSSKEMGIFMLADTVEAAMKSAGYTHLDDAEELIRKLVKNKVEQNQLVDSGLSFFEVEEIIKAFLQVYAGQFHERIKYPDASANK